MTIDEFIHGNKVTGKHYFDKDTMRFFASKVIYDSWNGDGLFLTSEQNRGAFSGHPHPRLWTIRRGNLDTFAVETVGTFQGLQSLHLAKKALAKMRAEVDADKKQAAEFRTRDRAAIQHFVSGTAHGHDKHVSALGD